MNKKYQVFLYSIIAVIGLQGCSEDDSPAYNFEEQLAKDVKIIDEYLAENNITVLNHSSGLRYVIHEEGNGSTPGKGSIIVADYKGTLMNGTVFDSSYDKEPFEFILGAGRVIPGWDIGFSLLKQDSKATLYIPSGLAYGPNGQGQIGPNEILIFEVELLDFY